MKDERPAVLLDFGGTLDSEGKHWSTQFADSFTAAGLQPARSALDAAFIAVDRAVNDEPRAATMSFADYVLEYAQRILVVLGEDAEGGHPQRGGRAQAIARHFLASAQAHLRRNGALLLRHRARFRFAVVSNFTANLPLIIEEVGLGGIVDDVFCSAIEGVRKPDPAFFRLALHRLGVDDEDVADVTMIGDSLRNDIEPAKSLGLTTVWLRGDAAYGGGQPSDADHVVTSLAEGLLARSRAPVTELT